jgi:hypothetical protein
MLECIKTRTEEQSKDNHRFSTEFPFKTGSNAERKKFYSKSICILFKQQIVYPLPCLILYSLFCFKFPLGIIININWSPLFLKHTLCECVQWWTERTPGRKHRYEIIFVQGDDDFVDGLYSFPHSLHPTIITPTQCCNETIYPKHNTLCVCHQYNIFNLFKRSRFWFSVWSFSSAFFSISKCEAISVFLWHTGRKKEREKRKAKNFLEKKYEKKEKISQ